jgi:ribosomal protein S18 acetylase RimI-like enzyme
MSTRLLTRVSIPRVAILRPVTQSRSVETAVRAAGAADVPRLAGALAAAFEDDPVARRRAERLRRYFALELRTVGLARGRIWAPEDLGGAALTTPPAMWRLPWSVQLAHGVGFTRAFGLRLPWAAALLARMERRHLREPHHYVAYVGVAPAAQGRGLGTRLLRPTLERCDADGLPAYLEATAPRNIALYERLGFAATDEVRLGGSPPLTLMVRSPGAGG